MGSAEVVDPDVDPDATRPRRETRPPQWDLILATGVGGVIGAEARYGLSRVIGHGANQFPWSTVLVNVSGCLLIGVLMVVLRELTFPHRVVRPFLGVGILGGYTTYSTFAVDVQGLLLAHRPVVASAYVVVTVIGCAAAVWSATVAAQATGRRIVAGRVRRRPEGADR